MNDHHLEKIEARVHREQTVDDPVIDRLAESMPQARHDFQQQLEDQLLARFQAKGASPMTAITASKPRLTLPLTLAAALLAVVFVASILTFGQRPNGDFNMQVLQQPTATATVEPTPTVAEMTRILVAFQNLPRGFQFPATVDELDNIVGYVNWPLSALPINAFVEGVNGLEELAGKVLLIDVSREQPVMGNMIGDELIVIPEGALRPVVVALQDFPRGTRIEDDIASGFGVVYWPAGIAPETAFEDIASLDGLILHTGATRWQPILQNDVLADAISASPDDAAAMTIPSDRVAVSIPLRQITSVNFGLQQGDRIDVVATMLFIDVDAQFQANVTPDATPVVAQPNSVTQKIAENAMVVFIGSIAGDGDLTPQPFDVVTLAVSPEDAAVLRWAIEAMLRLEFLLTDGLNTDANAPETYRQLGFTDYRQRNYEGAIENFTQCVNLGSQHIDCYYLRGLAHYYLGHCDDAWNVLQDSLIRVQRMAGQEPVLSAILEGLKRVQQQCPAYADKIIATHVPLLIDPTPTLAN